MLVSLLDAPKDGSQDRRRLDRQWARTNECSPTLHGFVVRPAVAQMCCNVSPKLLALHPSANGVECRLPYRPTRTLPLCFVDCTISGSIDTLYYATGCVV